MNHHPDDQILSFKPVLRFGTVLISIASIFALFQLWQIAGEIGYQINNKFLVGLILLVAGIILLNLFTWSRLSHLVDKQVVPIGTSHRSSWLYLVILLGLIALVTLIPFRDESIRVNLLVPMFNVFWIRILLLTSGIIGLDLILWVLFRCDPWKTFILMVLSAAFIWRVLIYFPFSMNYPFSLGWSETSWYYYASFFFADKIYGTRIIWPFLDIGKPLLLSAIYWIPNTPLWLMRLWEFMLWIGVAALVAFLFLRRTRPKHGLRGILFLWVFVWMLLGPVYFHLALGVALVLWKFDRDKLGRTIFWVGLASIWTGALRINWIPVPAMLALALYFMETPQPASISNLQYLKRPAWLGLTSLVAGAGSFIGYGLMSGRLDTRVVSKLSATFLWYRLWPNASMQTGIILGILIVSSSLLVMIYASWRSLRYANLRLSLILSMLGILFAGGVIASMKIGGGNNLHNLDAFLVLLMFWSGYALSDRIVPEQNGIRFKVPVNLLALLCFLPSVWSMQTLPNFQIKDVANAQNDLTQMQELIQSHVDQGESVLFIYQRHLLTFGMLPGVPVVQDYELLELMEMAMSNNQTYLQKFRADLKAHRFGLIVTNVELGKIQDRKRSFSDENNAWVRHVIKPLRASYHSILILPDSQIEIFAPNP